MSTKWGALFISIHPGYGQSVNICFGYERKKLLFCTSSTKAHVRCTIQQNGSQSKSTIETSGCVTVFEDLNNFVDMNGSIYR